MTRLRVIGLTIGQYDSEEEIRRGGMATVYRARQASIERDTNAARNILALAVQSARTGRSGVNVGRRAERSLRRSSIYRGESSPKTRLASVRRAKRWSACSQSRICMGAMLTMRRFRPLSSKATLTSSSPAVIRLSITIPSPNLVCFTR